MHERPPVRSGAPAAGRPGGLRRHPARWRGRRRSGPGDRRRAERRDTGNAPVALLPRAVPASQVRGARPGPPPARPGPRGSKLSDGPPRRRGRGQQRWPAYPLTASAYSARSSRVSVVTESAETISSTEALRCPGEPRLARIDRVLGATPGHERSPAVRVPANRAGQPVSYGAVLDGELIFIPGEIPRRGVFAHWGRGAGSAKVELVFPGGRYGIRKRLISADFIPLAEALPALLAVGAGERMRLSGQAWAAAAAAGVGLITRGRLLPTVGADGTDVWRAGPLDPADLSLMRQLAAAFPAAAHALAVPGSRPIRP